MTSMILLAVNPLGDWLLFPLFEATVVCMLFYAAAQDFGILRPDGMTDFEPTCDETARKAFHLGYLLAAFFLAQIVNSTTSSWGEETKTFWHLFHLAALGYLAFFSAWGRAAMLRTINAFHRWPQR